MRRGVWAAIAAIATVSCAPSEQRSRTPLPAYDHLGSWTVVGHRLPGASAMTDDEAKTWHGRVVRFSSGEAVSGEDRCPYPTYQETEVSADSFLMAEFHVRATALGLEHAHLRLGKVICYESTWTAMGGIVLWDRSDHGYAVWDGVFFELRPSGPGNTRA